MSMDERSGERQGLLLGNGVYLENNKDLFLGMGFAHTHTRPGKHPFSINTFHTGTVHTECKHEQGS